MRLGQPQQTGVKCLVLLVEDFHQWLVCPRTCQNYWSQEGLQSITRKVESRVTEITQEMLESVTETVAAAVVCCGSCKAL